MTKRPSDWDEREDQLVAPVREELDTLAARHRDDLPAQVLRAADTGALPEALQEHATAALESSAWNRALAAEVSDAGPALDRHAEDRLLARIRRDAQQRPAARPAWFAQFWRPALALAAAAVVVTTVVWRLQPSVGPGDLAPQTTATVGVAKPAPSFRLALDKPEVKLTAMALVRRSTGRNATFADEVAPAMNAYRAGDYRTAAAEFVRVQPLFPDSVEIPFYLGVTRLFLDDASGAIAAFEAARNVTDDTFRADIAWYAAVARERAGNTSGARAELDALCGGQSAYTQRACEAVTKFK
jgi:TolA-binding protein